MKPIRVFLSTTGVLGSTYLSPRSLHRGTKFDYQLNFENP